MYVNNSRGLFMWSQSKIVIVRSSLVTTDNFDVLNDNYFAVFTMFTILCTILSYVR